MHQVHVLTNAKEEENIVEQEQVHVAQPEQEFVIALMQDAMEQVHQLRVQIRVGQEHIVQQDHHHVLTVHQ